MFCCPCYLPIPYWRLSGFYFCYFATLGAFLPFWSLYLRHIGFTSTQIGELTALLVATKVVAPYLWGWLADKTGRNLGLIRITSLLSTLIFAGFLLVHDYRWMASVTIGFSLFWNATLPQFEAATLLHLREQPQRYSHIRLWGSIGFIAAVLGIGRFLDDFPIERLPLIITGLLALNWLMALITPETTKPQTKTHSSDTRQRQAITELMAFFGVYMLLQVAHGPYYTFYSVYLQQHGYSTTQTGLLWSLGVCAEILIFLWMSRLQRWLSLRTLLLSSLLLSMSRWLMIADGVDYWQVIIAAQLLHAASFGVAHVVAIQLLNRYFGEHHPSKGQALYSSLSFGLGGMLGSYFSGYFWDRFGGDTVFTIAAWACGLAWLIGFIGVARHKPSALG